MSKRMMMVDSGCAPTDDFIRKYNLSVMGMKVILDEKSYWDWTELDPDTYYDIIRNAQDFHTNPPTLWDIFDTYEKIRDNGYDELIDIHFSEKMSDTIKICERARKMVKGIDVKIIDTETVSAGAFLIAEKIVSLLDKGMSYADVSALLPEIRASSYVQFSVPTVKYLVKNGRIGKAQGFAALVLKIKPVLGVSDGVVVPVSKEKGIERVCRRMAENAFKFIKKRRHNVKVHIAYGFDSSIPYADETYAIFNDKFKKLNIDDVELIRGRILPTVACHSGPEVFGIAVYGEKKPIG